MHELQEWAAFEAVTGPVDIRERIDAAVARAAYVIARTLGAKVRMEDLLPRWGEPGAQTVEEQIAVVRSIQGRLHRGDG